VRQVSAYRDLSHHHLRDRIFSGDEAPVPWTNRCINLLPPCP
jgi:hypothetical protein